MTKTSTTTTTTISPTTITLDDCIVNTSYNLDNIVDWQDNLTITTVDVNEPPVSITLGKVKLTEEKLEKHFGHYELYDHYEQYDQYGHHGHYELYEHY